MMLKNNKINRNVTWWNAIFNKKFYWLLGALSALAIIKIFINIYFPFDLHSEEAQYWVWSKRLQLSYYSKPPMIAYMNWISTSIFGDTVLGIRINSILIGFLVSVVSYLFAYELFKDIKTAVITAVVTNIFPFLISISSYFSTDTPLILFWVCAMLFYWKAAETREPLWWVLFGISIGLGALSKYTIFLIFIPLVLFTWKHHREIFRSVNFYLSILVGLLIFSLVIYWNVRQNGVGFQHIAHLTGMYDQHHSVWKIVSNMLKFTIGQIAFLLPFYQYHLIYLKYKTKTLSKEEEYLIIPVLSMFFIFLSVSAIRPAGAYINWAMFAYTGVPVLFAHYALNKNLKKRNLYISFAMGMSLLLLIGLASPYNKIMPLGKKNPANKFIGWSQLASKVDSIKATQPIENCYVFSTNYHISSELWFYLSGQSETFVQNMGSRMTQFDLWPGIGQFMNSDKIGIYVDSEKISPKIKEGFNTIMKEDSCLIYNQGKYIETYYIYCLKGLKGFPQQHKSF